MRTLNLRDWAQKLYPNYMYMQVYIIFTHVHKQTHTYICKH